MKKEKTLNLLSSLYSPIFLYPYPTCGINASTCDSNNCYYEVLCECVLPFFIDSLLLYDSLYCSMSLISVHYGFVWYWSTHNLINRDHIADQQS